MPSRSSSPAAPMAYSVTVQPAPCASARIKNAVRDGLRKPAVVMFSPHQEEP